MFGFPPLKRPFHKTQATRPKYSLSVSDFKDFADEGQWRSYDLETEGDTLEELLANAVYFMTDQDGGSLGDCEADDDKAQAYIEKWLNEKMRKEFGERIAKAEGRGE